MRRDKLHTIFVFLFSINLLLYPQEQSKPENFVQIGHNSTVSSIAFSPDSKTIVSGSYDRKLILWDILTGKEIRTFSGKTVTIKAVFSYDRNRWRIIRMYVPLVA